MEKTLEIREKNVCQCQLFYKTILQLNLGKSRFVKVFLLEMRSKCPFGSPLPIPFFEYTQQALHLVCGQNHKYSSNLSQEDILNIEQFQTYIRYVWNWTIRIANTKVYEISLHFITRLIIHLTFGHQSGTIETRLLK